MAGSCSLTKLWPLVKSNIEGVGNEQVRESKRERERITNQSLVCV